VRSAPLAVLILAWGAIVLGGNVLVWRYERTPGARANAPLRWPPESALAAPTGRSRLLVFAHPGCPCTRATLDELREILSQDGARVDATIVFVDPPNAPADFDGAGGTNRALAASIPGLGVVTDGDGREARRFGARVSGEVLVFARSGDLIFNGGVTAGRGHEGDNPGRRRVISLLETGRADRADADVFGCELFDD
jgi:hypothetical protein